MNLRHRLCKLESRIPPPREPVTLVWMSDGVPSYVLISGEGELHGEDARRYIDEEDQKDAKAKERERDGFSSDDADG